jgi:hypothetical protein
MSAEDATNRRTLYERVCTQHDGIAEFRGKLLSMLPIASGAGIFFLFDNSGIPQTLRPHLVAIGVFGLAVTTGLFLYELRGIQKCNALIQSARLLEQALSPEIAGAFRSRPPATWGVGAETAALIVYPAVAGAWAYLGSLTYNSQRNATTVLIAVSAVVVYAFLGHKVLRKDRDGQQLLERIRTLNRQSFLAEDRRDRTILEPILDEAFRIDRSGGVQQNKDEVFEGLAKAAPGRRVIRRELIQSCGPTSAVALTLIQHHEAEQADRLFLEYEGLCPRRGGLALPIVAGCACRVTEFVKYNRNGTQQKQNLQPGRQCSQRSGQSLFALST